MSYTGTSPSFIVRLDKFIAQSELESTHQQQRPNFQEHFYSNHGKCLYLNHAIKKVAGKTDAMVLNAFINNGKEDIKDVELSLLRVCTELIDENSHVLFNLTELAALREMMETVDYLYSGMAKAYYLIVMDKMVTLQAYGRGNINELVIRSSYYIGEPNAGTLLINKNAHNDLTRFYKLVKENVDSFTDEQAVYVKNICNDFVFINTILRKGMLHAMEYLEFRRQEGFNLTFLTNLIFETH